ncbi:hypothetical protein GN956_G22658 [Arapaima gigas]
MPPTPTPPQGLLMKMCDGTHVPVFPTLLAFGRQEDRRPLQVLRLWYGLRHSEAATNPLANRTPGELGLTGTEHFALTPGEIAKAMGRQSEGWKRHCDPRVSHAAPRRATQAAGAHGPPLISFPPRARHHGCAEKEMINVQLTG